LTKTLGICDDRMSRGMRCIIPRDTSTFRNRADYLYTGTVDNIAEYSISCSIY